MRNAPPPTSIVVAVLILIWGTTWAAIRVGLTGIPPLAGVALRFAIGSAVLLAVGLVRKVPFGRARHEKKLWLVNALFSFCGSYIIVYWSEQYVPSGLSAVLWATFPLFVAIGANFFIPGERLTRRVIAGTLIGFGGVAVIFSEDLARFGGPKVALASAVLLISPFFSAVSNTAIKRWGHDVPAVSISAVPMGIAAVVVGAASLIFERGRPIVWNGASIGALLYLAVCGSAVTFGLYYWLLAQHKATRVSMIAYATPVVAVLFGVSFMHEPLTPLVVAGAALVIGGVVLAVGGGGH